MALHIASINSGSNGNCYYVGTASEAILVDAGISCRETERRMSRLGLSMQKVKAVFISHEHSDHIKGVETLSKKYQLPVYISDRTFRHSGLTIAPELLKDLGSQTSIQVGQLLVIPFSKQHDAADPYSFNITNGEVTLGVYTDIGHACDNIITHFKKCNAVFLEANYDEEMLDKGHYPAHLKFRIKSNKGHLSNAQALDLFLQHRSEKLSHVFLSHLSKDNNDPQRALDHFLPHARQTNVSVASRYNESSLHIITGNNLEAEIARASTPVSKRNVPRKSNPFSSTEQLSLF